MGPHGEEGEGPLDEREWGCRETIGYNFIRRPFALNEVHRGIQSCRKKKQTLKTCKPVHTCTYEYNT